jgi:hypothetical protein
MAQSHGKAQQMGTSTSDRIAFASNGKSTMTNDRFTEEVMYTTSKPKGAL